MGAQYNTSGFLGPPTTHDFQGPARHRQSKAHPPLTSTKGQHATGNPRPTTHIQRAHPQQPNAHQRNPSCSRKAGQWDPPAAPPHQNTETKNNIGDETQSAGTHQVVRNLRVHGHGRRLGLLALAAEAADGHAVLLSNLRAGAGAAGGSASLTFIPNAGMVRLQRMGAPRCCASCRRGRAAGSGRGCLMCVTLSTPRAEKERLRGLR